MSGTSLEPILYPSVADTASSQAVATGAYGAIRPENSFESTLAEVEGGIGALGFLAGDGLAFANAENPSFGGTVVSTAISNLGFGNPYATGYGYGSPAAVGGFGGGAGLSGGGQFLPNALATNPAFNGGGGVSTGGSTVDGFGAGNVKQAILDEGLQQIMLMVQVQQASRTLDAMSNILKTQHDANMNTIRNIRS